MLPKNKLRDRRLERLKIFVGPRPNGIYNANVVKRWDDGTLKAPRERDVKKWEEGVIPEIARLERAKERQKKRKREAFRAVLGRPM